MYNNTKNLVLAGTGIKAISHISTECHSYIKTADSVLYLLNNEVLCEWVKKESRNSYSLSDSYFRYSDRISAYKEIEARIADELEKSDNVCVLFYGHPTVFATPGLNAAKEAKQRGANVKILPAVSAEDCLYADLMFDPGDVGCFSIEATKLLASKKELDISVHNIIWQIGVVGDFTTSVQKVNIDILSCLQEFLLKYISEDVEVSLYEAAIYPGTEPYIKKIRLDNLIKTKMSSITTMYIPPQKIVEYDYKVIK